jgi:hypothetical protein
MLTAAALGYQSLWTLIAEENKTAKAFFRRCGFSEASRAVQTVGRRSRASLLVMSRLVSRQTAMSPRLSPGR